MSAPTSTIRTAEELAALPVGTVLRDGAGVVWLKFSGVMTEWRGTHGGIAPSEFVARKRWPLTVLYRPDLPTQADLHAERDRLRAVLRDIADHGLRADLTPTVDGSSDVYRQMTAYLRRLDASVRERARRVLDTGEGL